MASNPDCPPLEWVSKRNCALTPRQLALLLAAPAGASLLIAISFASRGAWWILVFSLIEVVGLVAAYLYYARHAGAYERLFLSPGRLILEFHSGSSTTREELDPWLARIEVGCARIPGFDGEGLVIVSGAGRSLRLGRFVPVTQRPALAAWLRQEVRQAMYRGTLVSRGDPVPDASAEPQTAS